MYFSEVLKWFSVGMTQKKKKNRWVSMLSINIEEITQPKRKNKGWKSFDKYISSLYCCM